MAQLSEIVDRLDGLLLTAEIPDYPGALNGLQFTNSGIVHGVAAAVDLSLKTIRLARAEGANLLIVHHGMFWGGAQPIVGANYERVRLLLEHDMAVYSSHIPLDAHPVIGNNALLARELGLDPGGEFGRFQNIFVGMQGQCELRTDRLIERVRAFAAGHSSIVRCSTTSENRITRRWAICTGAGASMETLQEAQAKGIDTLIVGEGPHHTAVAAPEMGVTIIYAGHYASETLGVRALAEQLGKEYVLPWAFVNAPTGL